MKNFNNLQDYTVTAIYINRFCYGLGLESGSSRERNYIVPMDAGLLLKTKAYFFNRKIILIPWHYIEKSEEKSLSKFMPKLTSFCFISVSDRRGRVGKRFIIKVPVGLEQFNLNNSVQQHIGGKSH